MIFPKVLSLFAVVFIVAVGPVLATEPTTGKVPELSGQVVILKEGMTKPAGPVDPGSLIVANIQDSGSRPPQDIKVDGGDSIPLGHVRGVNSNDKGQSMMGGGYTWYLFKAPSGPKSVHIRVSYVPNGGDGKPVSRDHQVHINRPAE
jgi:hypothetical protein